MTVVLAVVAMVSSTEPICHNRELCAIENGSFGSRFFTPYECPFENMRRGCVAAWWTKFGTK